MGYVTMLTPEEWILVLEAFKDVHKHCNVPKKHTETHIGRGWKLGTWLNRQRNAKKKGVLDKVVETKMTDLGVEGS